jgi:molecular chaperone GrpE (heat shock protein)
MAEKTVKAKSSHCSPGPPPQNGFPFRCNPRNLSPMAIPSAPKVIKWPFFVADFILVVVGSVIAWSVKWPPTPLLVLGMVASFISGAVILVYPFLREHAGAVKLWEQVNLAEAAQQLDQLVTVANRVVAAAQEWEGFQSNTQKLHQQSGHLVDRMAGEAKAFSEFLQRTDVQEKQALRFELEKVRRQEAEMLQVLVHLLDHVHALRQAGERSGQPQLAQQLANFRSACLETARRVGLLAFESEPGSRFDPHSHQTVDGREPSEGALIGSTVACGYTFQGQPVRRILVTLQEPASDTAQSELSVHGSEASGDEGTTSSGT